MPSAARPRDSRPRVASRPSRASGSCESAVVTGATSRMRPVTAAMPASSNQGSSPSPSSHRDSTPMASSSAMVTVVAVVVSTGADIDGFTSVAPMSRDGHAS